MLRDRFLICQNNASLFPCETLAEGILYWISGNFPPEYSLCSLFVSSNGNAWLSQDFLSFRNIMKIANFIIWRKMKTWHIMGRVWLKWQTLMMLIWNWQMMKMKVLYISWWCSFQRSSKRKLLNAYTLLYFWLVKY